MGMSQHDDMIDFQRPDANLPRHTGSLRHTTRLLIGGYQRRHIADDE
jgi:hypothetical protein